MYGQGNLLRDRKDRWRMIGTEKVERSVAPCGSLFRELLTARQPQGWRFVLLSVFYINKTPIDLRLFSITSEEA
jgi:hypothetical protein